MSDIELTIEDYKAVIASHHKLVRDLDVELNGDGAAKQASLCDLVGQIKWWRSRYTVALRGGNGDRDNPELLEWLADRLVNVHGENENTDFIRACHTRAAMIRNALKD